MHANFVGLLQSLQWDVHKTISMQPTPPPQRLLRDGGVDELVDACYCKGISYWWCKMTSRVSRALALPT